MSGFTGRAGQGYREDDPDLLLAIALSKSLMVRACYACVRAWAETECGRP